MAGTLAQEAERKTMAHFQRDGYKIIVLAEVRAPFAVARLDTTWELTK